MGDIEVGLDVSGDVEVSLFSDVELTPSEFDSETMAEHLVQIVSNRALKQLSL